MIRSIVFPPPVVVPTLKTIPALLLPIPHRILFTYKSNILETKEPKLYYENIQNTIQQYQTFWTKQQQPEEEPNINNIAVEFLDNAACRHHIEIAAPALVPYFDTEPKGMFKGDMCRTAALYNQGGYYFDVDIHVIQPISLEYNISFATVVSSSGVFFQAFLASTKHHPILQRTLQEMLHYYQNKPLVQWFLGLPMGCETLTRAYQSLTRHQRGNTRILQEMNLASIWKKNLYYPQLPRQVGKGHLCNYIVHDALEQQPYFFSRLVGSFRCPYPNTTYTQFLWQWLGNE
jgi:mannosyltransferase OCH1-like enzyme